VATPLADTLAIAGLDERHSTSPVTSLAGLFETPTHAASCADWPIAVHRCGENGDGRGTVTAGGAARISNEVIEESALTPLPPGDGEVGAPPHADKIAHALMPIRTS
jgi:hypothetical protein